MKRKWHHWKTWECVPAGMYETVAPGEFTPETALSAYTEFLSDIERFKSAMMQVMQQWAISCEQFLTNLNINRIAWLGQSSMCIATGVPAKFRAGFSALEIPEQREANAVAAQYLQMWEKEYGHSNFAEIETETPAPTGLQPRIAHYIATWERRGYENGIPDEVPPELMRLNLAPSHKAIALAILRNDHAPASLGYSQPVSPWYNVLKRIEIEGRTGAQIKMSDPMF